MNPLTLTIGALLVALIAQTLVTALAIEAYFANKSDAGLRRIWLIIAIGSTPLALHHGYTLELALRTGLYDLRQALLVGFAGLFIALGIYGLNRRY